MADIFTYKDAAASLLSPFTLHPNPPTCYTNGCGIAPETDSHGAIEYKLHMVNPSPSRLAQLTTQLQWRLTQGQGQAIYEIGVSDDGTLVGLLDPEIYASLHTLKRMAGAVEAWFKVVRVIPIHAREAVDSPTARTRRRVVEVHVFKIAPEKDVVRVFFIGGSNTGKSSLLGKICYDTHDNGRGKARMKVLKHRHELASGKTSSIGIDVFGYNPAPRFANPRPSVGSLDSVSSCDSVFTSDGEEYNGEDEEEEGDAYSGDGCRDIDAVSRQQCVVISNYGNKYTHEEIVASSQRVVMTFDTPGTCGKLGLLCRSMALYSPEVTVVTVSGGGGSSRWVEYLELALRTTGRVAVLLTKCDTFINTEQLKLTLHEILLKIAAFKRSRYDDGNVECVPEEDEDSGKRLYGKMVNSTDTAIECALNDCCVPVFLISAVSGTGVTFLHEFLNAVKVPSRINPAAAADGGGTLREAEEDVYASTQEAEKEPDASVFFETAAAEIAYDHLLHHTSSCNCTSSVEAAARASSAAAAPATVNGGLNGAEEDEKLNFFVTSVYDSGRILTGVVRSGTLKLGRTYYLGVASSSLGGGVVSSSDESEGSSGGSASGRSGGRRLVRIIVRSMQKLRVPCLQLREGEIGSIGIEIVGASSMATTALLECGFRVRKHMSVVSAQAAAAGAAMNGIELELSGQQERASRLKAGDTVVIYNGFERTGEVVVAGGEEGEEEDGRRGRGGVVVRLYGSRGEYVSEGQRVIVDVFGEKVMGRVVRGVRT
ncbi:hypothetical protein BZA70DRAFT_158920 [Myxozyma melibiosi]|uniref:Tr-type G domain-containing protein n=1 Tax=Myxozyma melibiosi TaxID=54550 RepID=A0ABR1F6K8_9ASCO